MACPSDLERIWQLATARALQVCRLRDHLVTAHLLRERIHDAFAIPSLVGVLDSTIPDLPEAVRSLVSRGYMLAVPMWNLSDATLADIAFWNVAGQEPRVVTVNEAPAGVLLNGQGRELVRGSKILQESACLTGDLRDFLALATVAEQYPVLGCIDGKVEATIGPWCKDRSIILAGFSPQLEAAATAAAKQYAAKSVLVFSQEPALAIRMRGAALFQRELLAFVWRARA